MSDWANAKLQLEIRRIATRPAVWACIAMAVPTMPAAAIGGLLAHSHQEWSTWKALTVGACYPCVWWTAKWLDLASAIHNWARKPTA